MVVVLPALGQAIAAVIAKAAIVVAMMVVLLVVVPLVWWSTRRCRPPGQQRAVTSFNSTRRVATACGLCILSMCV